MVNIQSLAQFKKIIAQKRAFVILEHNKPEHIGEVRVPTVIQTNGFYSIEKDKPNSKVTLANNGKGYWLKYEKAACYRFMGDEVLVFESPELEKLIIKFRFLE